MDVTLKEVYSLVLTQWPLVAGAYVLLWAGLIVYVGLALKRMRLLERQVEVLESALARRTGGASAAHAVAGTSGTATVAGPSGE